MSSNNGKMSSSGTRSPLFSEDDEIPQNVADYVLSPIGEEEEEEESLEQNSTEENVSDDDEAAASDVNPLPSDAAASDVNPLPSDAAEILPMLQNLLLNNEIQRERLTGLIQLYDPTAQDANANVNATESEQIAREAALSTQIHLLQQSLQKLEEEIEDQKKLNAQLEEQLKSLTNSSDPTRQD